MNKTKKTMMVLFSVLLMSFAIVGCGQKAEPAKSDEQVASKDEGKPVETDDGKAKEVTVLRCGINNPESHPLAQGMIEFAKNLEENSDGAIKVEFYFGGQLGDKKTHLQSLQTGALDLYMIMAGNVIDYGAEALKILPLPYLFDNVEHARAVAASSIGQGLLDNIQESGTRMVGIGFYQESSRNFFFKDNPATTLDDLKGLKLRVQDNSMSIDLMNAFGVSATPVAFGELYSALQTGVVDGAEQPYSGFYANKFYEICKYYVVDRHETSPNIVLFSEMVWNTLSEEDQGLIVDSFNQSIPYFNELSDATDAEIIEELKANNVEIIEFEEIDKLKELAEPLYKVYGEGYEDIIEEIKNFEY